MGITRCLRSPAASWLGCFFTLRLSFPESDAAELSRFAAERGAGGTFVKQFGHVESEGQFLRPDSGFQDMQFGLLLVESPPKMKYPTYLGVEDNLSE